MILPRSDPATAGRPPSGWRWRAEMLGAIGAGAVVLGFCFVLLWHDPLLFWNDDYSLSIIPVFADVARAWGEGHLPLLTPYSWVCSNLAGEFQYGTFSVFVNAVVVLVWKLPFVYAQQAAALSMAHLFVLAAGGYLLGRGRKLPPSLALFVALVGTLNGWMICWGATDWFGALAAITWLPWSWWALEIAAAEKRPSPKWLLPAPFIYLLIAGGFPYTIFMLALVTLWLAARNLTAARNFGAVRRMAIGWAFGIGLSAPAWLSLLQYMQGSRRAGSGPALHREWLVPPSAWPAFILPSWTVRWPDFAPQWNLHIGLELACGLAPIVILPAAIFALRGRVLRALRWELALLALVLALCALPSPGMFRFSFRWLSLLHLALGLTAAEAFYLWQNDSGARAHWRQNPGAWSVIITASAWAAMRASGAVGWAGATSVPAEALAIGACWWVGHRLADTKPAARLWLPAAVAVAAFASAYLHVPTNPGTPKFNFSPALNRAAPLDPDRLYLSLYRAPDARYRTEVTQGPCGEIVRPGSTSMFGRVHLVNGYSPIAAAGIAQLLGVETHGQIEPREANYLAEFAGGPKGLLARLGVDGLLVASDFPMEAKWLADWKQAYSSEEGTVWHRAQKIPHAHVLQLDSGSGNANLVPRENSRHRVVVDVSPTDATKPVVIAFSRPYFPGYHATLDGRSMPVGSWEELMPTVELPAGIRGTLVLTYRPTPLVVGGLISGLSLLGLVAAFLFLRGRHAGLEIMISAQR